MIGHLGSRASALLDGQLSPAETEEAWDHVYTCHACRDLVEREGWIKTRLAGLDTGRCAPDGLKGSLMSMPPGDMLLVGADRPEHHRRGSVALIGSGAVGAALLGAIAIGLVPGAAPTTDRRPPATQINAPLSTPTPTPAPTSGATPAVARLTGQRPAHVLHMLP